MPVNDHRLGPGTLVFGASDDFSLQVSSCAITPNVSETDGTPTLANSDPAPDMSVSWTLSGNVISDWGDPDGFVLWALDNSGDEVAVTFTPSTSLGMVFEGTVQVRPVQIGGDAGAQSVVAFEMPFVGDPTYTPPSP